MFFIDTTFMSAGRIESNNSRISSLRHHLDLKKRQRQYNVNTNIDTFYFDFTPRQELKRYGDVHVQRKYIH